MKLLSWSLDEIELIMIDLAVKWYGSLCITTHNMVVSEYEYADLTTKSRETLL
jgi:hypothetical protein